MSFQTPKQSNEYYLGFSLIVKKESHIVPPLNKAIRLQDYGVGIFSQAPTKSALKKAFKKKYITVNDKMATTATLIKGGETITISIPEVAAVTKQLKLNLNVLYEDEYLAIIHKPPGILVSGNKFKTITRALPPNIHKSNLNDASAPQPVHRLDYATSGTLLIGKTSSSIRALNKLFENKKIIKTYFAITIGAMNSADIIKSSIEDKESITEYRIHKSVDSNRFGKLNLVELKPLTGRRHQIRIHMSDIGSPVLGDKAYGLDGLILRGKGLYLHAYSLKFRHPFTGESIHAIDPLPEKFTKIFPES